MNTRGCDCPKDLLMIKTRRYDLTEITAPPKIGETDSFMSAKGGVFHALLPKGKIVVQRR